METKCLTKDSQWILLKHIEQRMSARCVCTLGSYAVQQNSSFLILDALQILHTCYLAKHQQQVCALRVHLEFNRIADCACILSVFVSDETPITLFALWVHTKFS